MQLIIAHSRYQRRRFAECIKSCDELLAHNSRDEAAWMLKCSCLIRENEIDELEVEQDTVADLLMNDKQQNTFARVGTSFGAAGTANPIARPTTKTGRITTGFVRPGTSKQMSRAGGAPNEAPKLRTRAGMPMTSSGRALRLSTASLAQAGDKFFESDKMNYKNLAKKKTQARLIFKYLFYVEHNLKKALELAAEATQASDLKDPWWKLALGKCYYHMGELRDAEKQLLSSVRHNNNVQSYLYLSRIYQKEDQVQRSIEILEQGLRVHPKQVLLYINIGRIYDQINYVEHSVENYKNVLALQNCNIQAAANIAAYYFYQDQPQIASRMYQRLIQLGMNSPEVWNNLALCCFFSCKYDLFYSCFQKALAACSDQPQYLSDIWFNIGTLYINLGNVEHAGRCFRLAVNYEPDHAEALNNMAVLQARKNNLDAAISHAERSFKVSGAFDCAYNLSVWYYRLSNIKQAKHYNEYALKLYRQHTESLLLRNRLDEMLRL